ncbi:SDR family oxidoreductase [Halioxenophilus sp. WMMB6]|uniref:SDR family oxidoreductase n=1 Tax=Halioxenophilus sp. WMMB6 TaxID=3073815 RepID=UPI00295E6B85|nr:SDR family oxidoreductase [Halioxenophilus sp. WMMB6]
MANFQNELAIVVGATGDFGQKIVASLLNKGLSVMAVARTESAVRDLVAESSQLIGCVADIADDRAIAAIASNIDRPVRAVVHGPGVGVAGGILTAPTETMVDAVNIKVGGLLRLVRAADAQFTQRSRIIAIGGHYGLEPTAYAASAGVANAALVNVVRQLSLAYGARQITAHTIIPGPADTERLHRVAATRAEQRGVSLQQVLTEMRSESSLDAFTTPEQVAWAVTTLLEPQADAMTGSAFMLDSGRRKGLP